MRNRIITSVIATAALFLLSAAYGQQQQKTSGTNAMESFRNILLSNEKYFDVKLNKNMYLKDYWIYFSENTYSGPMQKNFAVVDMDGDGTPEIVLMYDPGELMVFRLEKGTVYGYNFGYRSMMNLKKDGTFSWSNSADSSGIGRQTFSGVNTKTTTLNNNDSQDKKEDIRWFDLTNENIDKMIK